MAKTKTENTENKTKFQETLDNLDKKYGKGTVVALDYKTNGHYDVISSGSVGFDWKTLGVGGFVKGKMYELMGWEGVGKSTICGHAVAECQKAGGKALYIDSEHALDKKYFQALGVDTSKMLISQPNSGEEGFNIAMEMIQSGELDLIVIDSDSSLIPKKVIDGEVGDSAIGKKALLNSNAYPKLKNALVNNKVCVLVVSQYREKIGMMFGNPTCTQGGHALKYYADCRIEISKSLAKKGDVVFGNTTKVKATKNKMCPPYRGSSFDIVYGLGIDRIGEVMELINEFDIAHKWGKKITIDENEYEIGEFKTLVEDNMEFYEELKEKIIDKIKNTEIPIEEVVEEEA